ncbi:MAG: ATP-binding cassette protein [Anaerocolumna sp.]|jgi:ABC-2 type transport system ATP-binding protein|nr:ATP-binding cassette protein [Anaerocolumna sp.]
MEEVVSVKNLTKDYKKGRGIYDVNFSIFHGEIFGLFGIKDCGKTTILHLLMGQHKADSGNCSILSLDPYKQRDKIKEHIIYVPAGVINFQESKRNSYFEWLTDSMKERELLFLEEPFLKLDSAGKNMYIECIKHLNMLGKTICISSECYSDLESICDRIALIHKGKYVNTVSKFLFDAEQERLYRVGFHKREEYSSFLNTCTYSVLSKNEQFNSLIIKVNIENFHILFRELKSFDIRNIEFVPYSYKWYYSDCKTTTTLHPSFLRI